VTITILSSGFHVLPAFKCPNSSSNNIFWKMLTKHSIQGKCCDLSSQTLSNLLLVLFLTFKTKLKFSPPGHCYLNPLIVFRQQVSFVWFSIWRLEKVLNEDFSSTGNGDIQEPILH
jgi:hypothetical protein